MSVAAQCIGIERAPPDSRALTVPCPRKVNHECCGHPLSSITDATGPACIRRSGSGPGRVRRIDQMKTRERIDLNTIDDNPWQPRGEIDPEALEELARSIQHMGLLQAPLGRPVSGRVQLAFGHRRVAALKLLHQRGEGESHVDMDVALITDENMAVMGLTENERRKDLSQMETLRAYRKAIDETELTAKALAVQLGIAESTLSNNLRVLALPDFILDHVESGDLGMTVAREFLVLQNGHHAHHDNMREIVHQIVDIESHGGQVPPNWSRKNVRKRISENISYSEKEFRPIGPKTGHETGEGHKEATFDTDAFAFEFADCLHTIPADDGRSENYHRLQNYDKSRVWTCQVREWSRRQSRATRERNAQAKAATTATAEGLGLASAPKNPSRDKVFEGLLAEDPVFKEIVFSREKSGPNRPATDEEREALGTRAEFRSVDYNTKFWKILERGEKADAYGVERLDGGRVPPWFPDLKECRRCTIGAAYAKSRDGYGLRNPVLVCFNKQHYLEKLTAGEAAYREKLQAHILGMDRQDVKAVAHFARQIQPLTGEAVRSLAVTLVAAKRGLDLTHPMGEFHEDWSYESAIVVSIRELLGVEAPEIKKWNRSGPVLDVDAVATLDPYVISALVPLLMAHHARVAGKVEELIQTPTLEPAAEEPAAETRTCTKCGEDLPLDAFGQQKKRAADGSEYTIPKAKCKQCLVAEELDRRERQATPAAEFASRNVGQNNDLAASAVS